MAGTIYTPLQMIERLVGFDTTSRLSNLRLIEFVAAYLRGHGVEPVLIHSPDGTKANLFATLAGEGPGGVMLSGHTDVVPVEGQPWSSDPFRLTRRGDRLHGRGAADMKSFCAIVLAMLPDFLARPLAEPVHLALSYDEEVGCIGVQGLIRHLGLSGFLPRLAIVGEPTGMQVVDAHKGCFAAATTVHGLERHSSAPQDGVNAVMYAAELICELGRMAEELRDRPSPGAERFDPPYGTVQAGRVHGGTAGNIVARECRIDWEYRALPGFDEREMLHRLEVFGAERLLPRMHRVSSDTGIETEVIAEVAGLRPEPGSAAETMALALTGSNRTAAVSYATEGGLFQQAGIPTVICGPGDIREAHRADEYIELSQVEACVGFMHRLIGRLAA